MCNIRLHEIYPLIEATIRSKGKIIIYNYVLEAFFNDLNKILYADNLINYPGWIIMFTVHKDSSDKKWVVF